MIYANPSDERCIACGALQGLPHAGGCSLAKYTIRRVA